MATDARIAVCEILHVIAVTGGCVADSRYLQHALGRASDSFCAELRRIARGDADPADVDRVRAAIEAAA